MPTHGKIIPMHSYSVIISKCISIVKSFAMHSFGKIIPNAFRQYIDCENTHLCCSLHKLLSPRRELMRGRMEQEAGSQGKEQKHNNNFVVKTPREDGERVTLCG